MALEDLAMFRAVPGSTIFYPSDAVSAERAVELAANTKGICFIRTSRPEVPILYTAQTKLAVGKAQVIVNSIFRFLYFCGTVFIRHYALVCIYTQHK